MKQQDTWPPEPIRELNPVPQHHKRGPHSWLFIGGVTLIHFAATIACGVASFSLLMARFDTGAPETLRERVFSKAADILMFPLSHFRFSSMPGVLLNSLLWALCLYSLIVLYRLAKARM